MKCSAIFGGLSILACATSCGTNVPIPPNANLTVERDSVLGGTFFTIEANEMVNGGRPKLTLSCETGHGPDLQFTLKRTPPAPPPLRGVEAVLMEGSPTNVATKFELAWATKDGWMLRDDRSNLAAIVGKALLSRRPVRISFPAETGLGQVLTWSPEAIIGRQDEVRRTCGL